MRPRLFPLLLLASACASKPSPTPTTTPAPSATAVAAAPSSSATPETPALDIPAPIRAAIDAEDRSEADLALDAGRHPDELFAFFEVKPGMRVAELMAGTGYTAELLARIVGPEGEVYGQNNAFVLEKFAERPWSERLKAPVNANVIRVDRELEDPLPAEAKDLDAVFLVLFYHDSVWMETDRAAMNGAIYDALKPGGIYAVVDHAAAEGAATSVAKTLHRIEESVVRSEIEAAGFTLEREGDFLRNSDDARDWNASPSASGERRGKSDRFVLKFQKPLDG